jgi:hypothetical protein
MIVKQKDSSHKPARQRLFSGFTIALSQARHLAQLARGTMLSDDALSVLIPILEEIAGWDTLRIRTVLESRGLLIQEWDRMRADWLTIVDNQTRTTGLTEAVRVAMLPAAQSPLPVRN